VSAASYTRLLALYPASNVARLTVAPWRSAVLQPVGPQSGGVPSRRQADDAAEFPLEMMRTEADLARQRGQRHRLVQMRFEKVTRAGDRELDRLSSRRVARSEGTPGIRRPLLPQGCDKT
jgi:hypothetical protein